MAGVAGEHERFCHSKGRYDVAFRLSNRDLVWFPTALPPPANMPVYRGDLDGFASQNVLMPFLSSMLPSASSSGGIQRTCHFLHHLLFTLLTLLPGGAFSLMHLYSPCRWAGCCTGQTGNAFVAVLLCGSNGCGCARLILAGSSHTATAACGFSMVCTGDVYSSARRVPLYAGRLGGCRFLAALYPSERATLRAAADAPCPRAFLHATAGRHPAGARALVAPAAEHMPLATEQARTWATTLFIYMRVLFLAVSCLRWRPPVDVAATDHGVGAGTRSATLVLVGGRSALFPLRRLRTAERHKRRWTCGQRCERHLRRGWPPAALLWIFCRRGRRGNTAERAAFCCRPCVLPTTFVSPEDGILQYFRM